MKVWHFYSKESGRFIGQRFSGMEDMLEANTPDGAAAIEGNFDHVTQCVDLATGEVIAYVPPQEEIEAQERQSKDETARRTLAEIDLKSVRAISAVILDPDDKAARAVLAELREQADAVRSDVVLQAEESEKAERLGG